MKKFVFSFLMLATIVISSVSWTFASPVGGSKYGSYRLPANMQHTFTQQFRSNEYATVTVEGDNYTDLELKVYNQYNQLVAWDYTYDKEENVCQVTFYVPKAARGKATYKIVIVNQDNDFNDYKIWMQ